MPKPQRKLRSCCGDAYLEPLYVVGPSTDERPQKTRIGAVPVCTRCRRPVGVVELDRTVAVARAFDAASWSLMEQSHPLPPYNYVPGVGGRLVPEEGYLPVAAQIPTQENP